MTHHVHESIKVMTIFTNSTAVSRKNIREIKTCGARAIREFARVGISKLPSFCFNYKGFGSRRTGNARTTFHLLYLILSVYGFLSYQRAHTIMNKNC